jgi:antagonist of KipI
MGYRLEGSLHGFEPLPEMISSGMIPGTIQVTRSGLVVILMADAQTTGGYHRIATVLQDDLQILAQKKPGETVGFRLI